jgi:hypothetical protein
VLIYIHRINYRVRLVLFTYTKLIMGYTSVYLRTQN